MIRLGMHSMELLIRWVPIALVVVAAAVYGMVLVEVVREGLTHRQPPP